MAIMESHKEITVEVVAEVGNVVDGKLVETIVVRAEDGLYSIGHQIPKGRSSKTWTMTHNGVAWSMRPWREYGLVIARTRSGLIEILSSPVAIDRIVHGKISPRSLKEPSDDESGGFMRIYDSSVNDLKSAVDNEIARLDKRMSVALHGARELLQGIEWALSGRRLNSAKAAQITDYSPPTERDLNDSAILRKWRQDYFLHMCGSVTL